MPFDAVATDAIDLSPREPGLGPQSIALNIQAEFIEVL
jgi:hypothetical protein